MYLNSSKNRFLKNFQKHIGGYYLNVSLIHLVHFYMMPWYKPNTTYTVVIHIKTWNFLGCYVLLYGTKAVISAYEIKFQFNYAKLYISEYTSQHIV